MKSLKRSRLALYALGLVVTWSLSSQAQLVRPRKPTEPAIKQEEKPYKTAPTRAEIENASKSPIGSVSVGTNVRNVMISFSAFPNTVPIVEVGSRKPVVGADGRFAFPRGSWSVARPAGGDQANGKYFVDMNQELEPGSYYYIINAQNDESSNAKRAQISGKFLVRSGLYLVRYKGFICDKTTDGPGSDEIYFAVTGVSPTNALEFSTEMEPRSGVLEDVRTGRVYVGPGRVVSWGNDASTPAYVSVMLMEHDYDDAERIKLGLETALGQGIASLAFNAPLSQLTGAQLAHAMYGASILAATSLNLNDDLIGVVTRTLSGEELREMATRPNAVEKGIQYDFFTEHRGQGGVYRIFFDVIETGN